MFAEKSDLFHPNFEVALLSKNPRSEDPKLIICVINFKLRYLNVIDRWADRQTDKRTTYDSNAALCTTCMHRAVKIVHKICYPAHFLLWDSTAI